MPQGRLQNTASTMYVAHMITHTSIYWLVRSSVQHRGLVPPLIVMLSAHLPCHTVKSDRRKTFGLGLVLVECTKRKGLSAPKERV